ncbi:MAG: hypothetical protein H7X86_03585 [Gorillibacterium sp.]|nr:hypothetical protein [Gorillibacterium sp.]
MSLSKTLKLVTGSLELLLGIPFLGAIIVVGSGYSVLWFMLIFHIVTLLISLRERAGGIGSIIGIVTSCLAWIPFVGMFLHLVTAAVLLLGGIVASDNNSNRRPRRNYLR